MMVVRQRECKDDLYDEEDDDHDGHDGEDDDMMMMLTSLMTTMMMIMIPARGPQASFYPHLLVAWWHVG
eukprot:4857237-Karenia_brevis.AAC.1